MRWADLFTVPTMNLAINIWHTGEGEYLSGPPSVVTIGNLSLGRRVTTGPDANFDVGIDAAYRFLALPKGTDIRGNYTLFGPDTVEVEAGSGYLYLVIDVERVGRGFSNEFLRAWCSPIAPQPLYLTSILPCANCTDGYRALYTLVVAGVVDGTGGCDNCTAMNGQFQLYYQGACTWLSAPFSPCSEVGEEVYWSAVKTSPTNIRLRLYGALSGIHYLTASLATTSGQCSGTPFPMPVTATSLDCDVSSASFVLS